MSCLSYSISNLLNPSFTITELPKLVTLATDITFKNDYSLNH